MELESLSLRILSAAINGGYQGVLLALLLWVGWKLCSGVNAATRHAVGFVALLAMGAMPVIHFLRPNAEDAVARTEIAHSEELWRGGMYSVSEDHDEGGIKISSNFLSMIRVESKDDHAELIPEDAMSVPEAEWEESMSQKRSWRTEDPYEDESAWERTAEPVARSWWSRMSGSGWGSAPWRASLSERASLGILGLWIALATLRLGKLAGECWVLRGLKRRGIAPSAEVGAAFDRIRQQMGVSKEARLLVVRDDAVPMAAGYWKPAVLLPGNMLSSAKDGGLEPILRHELAHLRRKDDWSNLVQQFMNAVWFFHPGVWWLSRRLTIDREIACDDHVLASARTPKAYALLLTEFAGRIQHRNCSAAPAGWSRHSQLKERITMILDPKRNASPQLAMVPTGVFITIATVLAAAGLSAAPRLELAQAEASEVAVESETVLAEVGTTATVVTPGRISVRDGSARAGRNVAIVGPEGLAPVLAPVAPVQPVAAVNVVVPRAPLEVPVQVPLPPNVQLHLAFADAPPTAPVPPKPAPAAGTERGARADQGIEQRIERLERLIEELMGQDSIFESGERRKPADKRKPVYVDNFDHDIEAHQDSSKEWEHKFEWEMRNFPEVFEAVREAQREAQRAVREANRQVEQSLRSSGHARLQKPGQALESAGRAPSWDMTLKVLEAQRQALEMQRKQLESQLEQLEKERDRVETRFEEHEQMMEKLAEEAAAREEAGEEHEEMSEEEAAREKAPKETKPVPSLNKW